MLNCRDFTRLVTESFGRRLTFMERCQVWLHISMCLPCRAFRHLQVRMTAVFREFAGSGWNSDRSRDGEGSLQRPELPPDARERLKLALRTAGPASGLDADDDPAAG